MASPGLRQWWLDTARADLEACAAKADEYGSVDLEIMGDAMRRLLGWEEAPERVGLELACAFYALGKSARMLSSYGRRQLPSDDTVKDLHAYTMMLRRIRETGLWP